MPILFYNRRPVQSAHLAVPSPSSSSAFDAEAQPTRSLPIYYDGAPLVSESIENPLVREFVHTEHYPDGYIRQANAQSHLPSYLALISPDDPTWAYLPGHGTEGQVHLLPYYNFRDIGGWPVVKKDGTQGHIRYGCIIRGTECDRGTPEHKAIIAYLRDVIGIKAELDMRDKSEITIHAKSSIAGTTYYGPNASGTQQYSLNGNMMITTNLPAYSYLGARNILKAVADCLSKGKPLYLHCVKGADRTGVAIALIMAVLGCDDDAIYKEYELTSLSFINAPRLISASGGFASQFAKSLFDIYPSATSLAEALRKWVFSKVLSESSTEIQTIRKYLIV